MSDVVNIGYKAENLDASNYLTPYSKVVVWVNDDEFYEAGDDTGKKLEVTIPWGSQQIAEDILKGIVGYEYRPFSAGKAFIDPAAELGDAVTVGDVYSGIYKSETEFGPLCLSDISAPGDEEIDHEYPYKSELQKTYFKLTDEFRTNLEIQSTKIDAKVEKVGGDVSSFGWSLTSDGFVVASNGLNILDINSGGAVVSGEIRATSGYIGSDDSGFTISASAIYNGLSSMSDNSKTQGIYIGTDGIKIGQKFSVDSSGNLNCSSGTFTGTVKASSIDGQIVQSQIGSGAVGGGQIGSGVIATSHVSNGAITYGKTGFTGTLDQVATNASNITALNLYTSGMSTFGNIKTNGFHLLIGGRYCSMGRQSVTIDGTTYNFATLI